MKKLLFLCLGLSIFAISARGQSADVSVGYSYFHLGGSGGINQNGVSGSIAINLKSWLGVVGDFGGYHATPSGVTLNTYTYLFGPRLTVRNFTKVNPFIQALLGGSHLSAAFGGATGSSSQFAYSVGGGVDIGLLPHLGLRPQVDYVGLNTTGSHTNCARVSVSFVVHF